MMEQMLFPEHQGDVWTLPAKSDLADYTFYFDFLPNRWFKETVKRYVQDCLAIQRPKVQTLHRYNYVLRHFFNFILESKAPFNRFSDLTHELLESFLLYTLHITDAASSRAVMVASLKHLILHGQRLEWDGFPQNNIFDGTEFRQLRTEDTLKTRIIPDSVMSQIRSAVKNFPEDHDGILITALVRIFVDTGIRVSEALSLKTTNLLRDLTDKPILEVQNDKNETDRFIPISNQVVQALKRVEDATCELRNEIGTSHLFIYKGNKGVVRHLKQYQTRLWLNKFIQVHHICENGNPYFLTPHDFRHTLGTDMINQGMSPLEVMNYLGHESLHSTSLYAKVMPVRLTREYKKVGFIGVLSRDIGETVKQKGVTDPNIQLAAALPDGICAKPLNGEGMLCKNFNMCLFCPKFITSPASIEVHRSHLHRVRQDKVRYMEQNFIGSQHHLEQVETVLEGIISQLERLLPNDQTT